ncbi:hypothetical protein E2C01_051836 [Portunus trituberculatus]|uniref:Uncharacterized protein n=1 Tax=Portunus trituberculatus TaxID=210409 RepID=A0A5B7GKS1_PORTR|nr:hypothetical protein [Portunus trituberculatus]
MRWLATSGGGGKEGSGQCEVLVPEECQGHGKHQHLTNTHQAYQHCQHYQIAGRHRAAHRRPSSTPARY